VSATQRLFAVTLVVPDYQAALDFYVGKLGFMVIEDVDQGHKRWIRIAPPGGSGGMTLVLGRAEDDRQRRAIGDQTGGRVFLFLETDDFARDHAAMRSAGVTFDEAPRNETYGTVAVWRDPFGNRWDLIERSNARSGPAAVSGTE
jgi:catechol 2,3-dioxygenase-like lactoylglutathione lyase family enzyme